MNRNLPAPVDGVVVRSTSDSVVIEGRDEDVEQLVDRIVEVAGDLARRLPDLASGAATVTGLLGTHRELVELTPRGMELLRAFGAVPSPDGGFWAFVRNGNEFAGNLSFKPVSLAGQRAVSLQLAAATIALRQAIRDVAEAVERVEGKVDEIVRSVRSERLGDAIADHRTLTSKVAALDEGERLSATFWSTIASLGQDIARDLDGLRSHVTMLLDDEVGATPGARYEAAAELSGGSLRELLDLIVIATANLASWWRLQLAEVSEREPEAMADTLRGAEAALSQQRAANRTLALALQASTAHLTDPRFLDGLDPRSRRDLNEARSELEGLTASFASEVFTDVDPLLEALRPSLGESIVHVTDESARAVGEASQQGVQAMASAGRRVGRAIAGALKRKPATGDDKEIE